MRDGREVRASDQRGYRRFGKALLSAGRKLDDRPGRQRLPAKFPANLRFDWRERPWQQETKGNYQSAMRDPREIPTGSPSLRSDGFRCVGSTPEGLTPHS